ncbi:sugar transferase [Cecembia lonarensis]|uniref:Putative colanic biosynthesis UDP-glucose lipid carrier transferase n=1 Tax=Cecembia lonarensis (strain CCUG 58316 / KCTC 22772 / LW9) TaxID=1225176 RepID=K1LYD2_CECL9|nr:sugar transferase [Cecembia lonarensis]EKB49129.1 Putative colanic biosynthesis UDP-glucose lipid carrier transferase [Cecembia lonarensis LW9]
MLKRFIDFSVSSIALLLLSIPMGVITILLVFFNKGAGAFFTQTRTGKDAKLFQIIKFKTMTDERDAQGKLLTDEQRMTPIGRFVRSTSLDELPQLFNVLIGDMSLVGPRPLLEKYIPLYSEEQFRRHQVKPGITGWAQVNGRNNISWKKKFELDVWYVDHQSFWLDMKILFLTLIKVIKRKDITTEDPKAFQPFNGKN